MSQKNQVFAFCSHIIYFLVKYHQELVEKVLAQNIKVWFPPWVLPIFPILTYLGQFFSSNITMALGSIPFALLSGVGLSSDLDKGPPGGPKKAIAMFG